MGQIRYVLLRLLPIGSGQKCATACASAVLCSIMPPNH
jgi:hypothetical protein